MRYLFLASFKETGVKDWSWVPGSLRKNDAWVSQRTNPWSSWSNCCRCLLAEPVPKAAPQLSAFSLGLIAGGLVKKGILLQCSEGSSIIRPLTRYRLGWFFAHSQATFSRKLLLCTTICSFGSLVLETAMLNITVVSSHWLAKKKM